MRVALGISYRGTAYHGWQIQPVVPTVQALLEKALKAFLLEPVATLCAGRTDAGVHAHAQVVHIDVEVERDEFSWVRGVNAFLPPDIRVQWARLMTADKAAFHARNAAVRRRYKYALYEAPVAAPHTLGLAGWVFLPLDDAAMKSAAQQWLGKHDFSAFRAAECQARDPVKYMYDISIERQGPWRLFTFEANAFLHHMVRNMMGTLIAIGSGRREVKWAAALLQAKDRKLGDPTFMPDGLYLDGVQYPDEFELNEMTWKPNVYFI